MGFWKLINDAKSVGSWGGAPDPDGGAYSAPPYPLAAIVPLPSLIIHYGHPPHSIPVSAPAPMSCSWANHLDGKEKESVKKLLSGRVFLFLHWNVLLPTFNNNASSSADTVLHVCSLLYRVFVITWLFLLVAYVSVSVEEEEQVPRKERSELVKNPAPAFKQVVTVCYSARLPHIRPEDELALPKAHRHS